MSSFPAVLEQALAQSEVLLEPELVSAKHAGAMPGLIMTLLADTGGELQVIQRADALLDLDSLNRELGRQLKAVPVTGLEQLLTRLQIRNLPAIPAVTGIRAVLAGPVGPSDPVCLNSGLADSLLQLPLAQYQQLVTACPTVDCAVPLDRIPVNFTRPEQDRGQIDQALKRFTKLRIKQRLDDTLELPPLPETARRIIHLRVEPNAEVGDLADIVESDPSLAAQVVSWANSSFYAASGQVSSIYDAIMRVLGFELVMNLAMGISLGRNLKQPPDLPDGYLDYWQQALWMAQGAGVVTGLMPRNRRPAFGLAYLAGLLHNFGFLVLAHVFPPHLALVLRYAEANRHLDTAYIEHHLLGVTREQIASQLMERWEVPPEVVTALRHQKDAAYRGPHQDYPLLLQLVRQLLAARGIPLGAAGPVSDQLVTELGLRRQELDEAMDRLVVNQQDIRNMAETMRTGK